VRRDPAFRAQFHAMCANVGVDPLASNKGAWAQLLGFGDFYYELGVQARPPAAHEQRAPPGPGGAYACCPPAAGTLQAMQGMRAVNAASGCLQAAKCRSCFQPYPALCYPGMRIGAGGRWWRPASPRAR